jgi:diguanylate cyclase (GGDEF)-like protein/PAS domain S-box-containing protein
MTAATRILLLEDNPFDAELIQHALAQSELEAEVHHVDNGGAFVAALQEYRPQIVLSDFSLPEYNGFEALKETKGFDASLPFILVTGAIGEEASVKILKRGADDYVLKDRLARLPRAIERALKDAEFQRQLRISEERYRLLMESSHYGIWDWDIAADSLYLSPQWKQQLGFADNELHNSFETFSSLLHPEDRGTILDKLDRFLERPEGWDVEFRLQHKDGAYRWFNSRAGFTKDANGKPNHMLGVHIDISTRKEAEQRLRQAAQVFSSTIEGVTITDPDGVILDVNPAFTEITGYSREEAIGHNPRILKSGRHDRGFYQALWESLQSEGHWSGEIWNRRADGFIYPELLTISAVTDRAGVTTGYVGVFADITKSKRTEAKLDFLAHHDPLTRLPNRLLLNARLMQSIKHAARQHTNLAVMFIDLDRFKNINDSFGHSVGDDLLKQVAERLKKALRSEDTLARISGDEFIVILENLPSSDNVTTVLHKIMAAFKAPFSLEQREIVTTCSVGISVFPSDGETSDELLRNADVAMYRAKEEGRNTYEFYASEMTASAFEHVFLENALHAAIKKGELAQAYQPQYRLSDRRLMGCETLVRWYHPEQGAIPPQRFIPIAEQNGTIREIDFWMLRKACEAARSWSDAGRSFGRISVNASGAEVQREGFANSVFAVLEETGLPHERLEIEVTEGFLMKRPDMGVRQLQELYDEGISIAMDDFGTGFSSLSYLKQLPVNRIKLDRMFISDITTDPATLAIVKAIIELAGALGKEIVAEGVETEEQAELLNSIGCEQAQGFYFMRPVDLTKMEALLADSVESDREASASIAQA